MARKRKLTETKTETAERMRTLSIAAGLIVTNSSPADWEDHDPAHQQTVTLDISLPKKLGEAISGVMEKAAPSSDGAALATDVFGLLFSAIVWTGMVTPSVVTQVVDLYLTEGERR